jgi:hypothetical protein
MGEELAGAAGGEVSLGSILQGMDVDKVDSMLSTLTKYEKMFDKVSGLVTKLDKIGVIPAIIRVAGVKANIPDLEKPLVDPLNVHATTGTHLVFFSELNKLPEKIISDMYKQMLVMAAQAESETVITEIPPKEVKP